MDKSSVGCFFVMLIRLLLPVIFVNHAQILFYSSFFVLTFISLYTAFFIIFILKHSLKHLFSASNLWTILISYLVFIFFVLFLFSSSYSYLEYMEKGYLTYGQCSSNFSNSMISSDSMKSNNYFYFAAITFFTVGYGDICPMGFAKQLSVLNAFIGVFINSIVVVVAISFYLKRKEMI